MKHIIRLELKKETKRALQYQVPGEPDERKQSPVPTVYVQKHAFPDCPLKRNWPQAIRVTVEGLD